MRVLRSTVCAALLSGAVVTAGQASEMASAAEGCDVVCQMQGYFNTDHMVHFVPRPELPMSAETKAPKRKVKTAASHAAAPKLSSRTIQTAAKAPVVKVVQAPRPAPAMTAQLMPRPEAVIERREVPAATLTLMIPGSVPPITITQFAEPSADVSIH